MATIDPSDSSFAEASPSSALSSEEPQHNGVIAYPEGGWQAWLTIFGALLVQFATFGYTNAFGVYQGHVATYSLTSLVLTRDMTVSIGTDFYVRDYLSNYTPSEIGWIGGVQIFLVLGSGIVTGKAFDKGYFYHLVALGSLLHSFSFFMLSLSQPNAYYQVFLSQGLGGGLGAGLLYLPSLGICSHYFERHRPFAMGVVLSGTGLGAVIQPIILNNLLRSFAFPNAVRISTAINSGLLLIAFPLMKTRLPPMRQKNVVPLKHLLKDVPYLLALFGGVLNICGITFPVFYLQLFAIQRGIEKRVALYCLPVTNAASIVGRVLPAFFSPKLGVFNLAIVLTFSVSILIFCLIAVDGAAGVLIFSILYGFVWGGTASLTPAMLASLAKSVDEIGVRIGVSFALSGIFGMVAVPIHGALVSSNFLWWRAIVFAGVTVFSAATCYTVARFLLARRQGIQVL